MTKEIQNDVMIKILILGGGFGGVEVLRRLEKIFQNDKNISLTLISKDNFFLFTPMLPEVISGSIETRHLATPLRTFCKKGIFYEANVDKVDLENKSVRITHKVGRVSDPLGQKNHSIKWDYLVISLGGEPNFFGNNEIQENSFTLKNLNDAMNLRNHLIDMLEQADLEHVEEELKRKLLTFVVVGAGFSGVETVGEINDFIRESVSQYYRNLKETDIKIFLIEYAPRILPEVTMDLAEFALKKLKEHGIEVILNTGVTGATKDSVKLSNNTNIETCTIIWTGGIRTNTTVSDIPCEHDKIGRLIVDEFLHVKGYDNVFAIGDCASILDYNTGRPYPPTAQNAIKQASVVVKNLHLKIKNQDDTIRKEKFRYKTRGIMALIGKRHGVGMIFGLKIQGLLAWWFWHTYYIGRLPSLEKRIRVIVDWTIDLIFKKDVARLKIVDKKRSPS